MRSHASSHRPGSHEAQARDTVPIHDQTYRRYTGRRLPRGGAWWVIARRGVAAGLRDRRLVALLLLAWAPFLVRAAQIYAAANLQQASFLAISAPTFRAFIGQQATFLFFVAVYVGAGLIADDRRAGLLPIYLSRPLTRIEYLVGKAAILVVFLLAVTWLPAMGLLGWHLALSGSDLLRASPHLVPAMAILCLIEVAVAALPMLALSSLSPSRRFVAALYAGVVLFTGGIATALRHAMGHGRWSWLSPEHALGAIGDRLFYLASPFGTPAGPAALALLTIVVASVLVLRRTISAVDEVVE